MELYSIFGNPVSHSKSPLIHNIVFKNYFPNKRYIRTHLNDGKKLKEVYSHLALSGASVTVPYKEIAFQLCDEVRGIAKKIKAVNCIVTENGKLIGYNTDVYGFLDSISEWKDIQTILIIGAGGTAKALTIGFLEENKDITIVNRSSKRLESFKTFPIKSYSWDNFQPSQYDLVVNVTSAGLNDEQLPMPKNILNQVFQNSKYAVDVIYHETPFLKLAKEFGLQIKDGNLMLIYQGVLANQLFVNGEIEKETIKNSMLNSLRLF